MKETAFWSVPLLLACNDFIFADDEDFTNVCVAGRRVTLDDYTEKIHKKRFSLRSYN